MRWREAVPLAAAAAAVAAGPAAGWAPASGAAVVRAAPADTSARAHAASPCAATCCGEDVRALLARAEARYDSLRSLQASFEQVVEVPLLDQKREGRGTWYQEGRARFRMDFSEPPHDLIVADGTHLWLYYPSTNPGQVVRTSLEGDPTGTAMADLEGRIFRQARTGFDATLAGREKVAGVATCRVDLVPQPGAETTYRKVRVWVGTRDFLVRRFEITEENETVRTVTLSDLRPDAAIPDSLFTFHAPAGVDVFSG
ncbi:MAG TPA: outer membrane lipoprotein carrier protein LolA [Gemmatimonadota bacterium]|nr:outer membrane lipoprotein carrier protein LolA [Gemmatimonadota bacterium]